MWIAFSKLFLEMPSSGVEVIVPIGAF